MTNRLKPNQWALLGALALVVVAWAVPGLYLLVLPLELLNTHLHEIGHALFAMGTGASGTNIEVFGDGSGVTKFYGGIYILTSPAGYIGATALGAMMIALSRDEKGARTALGIIGGLLTLAMIVWVRGDAIGITSGIAFAVLFILGAKFLRGSAAILAAQFVGLHQCLTSLQSVFDILRIGGVQLQKNDAILLQDATGIPALLSATLWTAFSLWLVFVTLRFAWSGRKLGARVERDRLA